MGNMKEVRFSKKQIEIFKELDISLIYVYGSQAQGTQTKLSDIDVGIVFDNFQQCENNQKEIYLKLYDIFTDIFIEYKKVDLVFLQATSIMLQTRAVFDGVLIYKKDDTEEFNYKKYVMMKHADTQYFRQMRQRAILNRIS